MEEALDMNFTTVTTDPQVVEAVEQGHDVAILEVREGYEMPRGEDEPVLVGPPYCWVYAKSPETAKMLRDEYGWVDSGMLNQITRLCALGLAALEVDIALDLIRVQNSLRT